MLYPDNHVCWEWALNGWYNIIAGHLPLYVAPAVAATMSADNHFCAATKLALMRVLSITHSLTHVSGSSCVRLSACQMQIIQQRLTHQHRHSHRC